MFFDMHSDILYDVVIKKLNKKKNIIKDYHLSQLLKGEIIGGIWNYYTDITPLCDFNQAIEYILEELEDTKDYIHLVQKNDIQENKLNIILGLESLQPVNDVNHLKQLYNLGFRHAMLTWNEQNKFATGVLGSETRGITEVGTEIIKFMNENKMIIDVSHANKKTFFDILKESTKPVIASHSNINQLCPHIRNLNDDQILEITNKGGLIGITAVKNFVNPNEPTINNFLKHLDYLKGMNLLKHTAFGFDFMDYFGSKNANLSDLESAEYTYRLEEALFNRNYSIDEINNITHKNALRMISTLL